MERSFWQTRWEQNQIGFHEGKPNELLVQHVSQLETKPKLRILVPLCGKAVDLGWLVERGHEVVGVEFVMNAIEAAFAERGLDARAYRREAGAHPAFTLGDLTLVCADMFRVTPEDVGRFDVIYDRAALVAVDPAMRRRYVDTCKPLLAPGGVVFLLSFEYDQTKMAGPPWSVGESEIRELHSDSVTERLETRAAPATPRLKSVGVESIHESAYLIRPKSGGQQAH